MRKIGFEAQRWGRHRKPACTLVPVTRLAFDGMLYEVDAVAALPA
ncbi:MAG: hypothetical protein HONDAALG_01854 [Gammaproteobacteria bacterium]|nr:hypothetical protein [Gammaproteobacteria bacterium]